MIYSAENYENMPLVDHKELMDQMPTDELLFHIIDLANFRYNHSPEIAGENEHRISRGSVMKHIESSLISKGHDEQLVKGAKNRVMHGNY